MSQVSLRARQRRQVPDVIEGTGIAEMRIERSGYIAFHEAEFRIVLELFEVAARSRNQIVQTDNAVSVCHDPVAEMRADESRRPRNEMTQGSPLQLQSKFL